MRRAVNLFSHSGGVAAGAQLHGIETVVYTTHGPSLRMLLQQKMLRGQLHEGVIEKFTYNLGSDALKDVDFVMGLVREDMYQIREQMIPNERGFFDESALKLRDQPVNIHRKTLYEIAFIATVANASHAVFFFTYNPDIDDTLGILLDSNFTLRLYEFACTGPLNPSAFIYCLVARRGNSSSMDYQELSRPLAVKPTVQPMLRGKADTPIAIVQRIVLWDIAPCLVDQMLQVVLPEMDLHEAKLTIIRTTETPSPNRWHYEAMSIANIYDISKQQVRDAGLAARLMGWPQDYSREMLYGAT